jgi:hypothetical protein
MPVNKKLINFLSNELINLRKGIGAIFYQHFHFIDSKPPFQYLCTGVSSNSSIAGSQSSSCKLAVTSSNFLTIFVIRTAVGLG